MNHPPPEVSIIMPCLNEAETLAHCIRKAYTYLQKSGVAGEIIVADNGSGDGSVGIAQTLGAKVIHIPAKGYGHAIQGGITAAQGRYIIIGDADDSYDFSEIAPLVLKLREGHDLVMGNRFRGKIHPGAMPFLHRYLGNPVLSFLGRWFTGSRVGDFHCGLRGLRRSAALRMQLGCGGMELATEMPVKAAQLGLNIAEVPVNLYPDGRSRAPHLRTWPDGWRHLRLLMAYSPPWMLPLRMLLGVTPHNTPTQTTTALP